MPINKQQLRFCKICKLKLVDAERGIVCSLTNDYPTFKKKCSTYVKDDELAKLQMQKVQKIRREQNTEENKKSFTGETRLILVIALIIVGIFMITDQDLYMKNNSLGNRRIVERTLMNLIWHPPMGVIALTVAGVLSFNYFKNKKTK
jgi:protein tyrosine phosphatase